MKIEKRIDCLGKKTDECHQAILLTDPNVVQVCHLKTGEHIILFDTDYNNKGELKDKRIDDLAWAMGLVTKFKDNKEIPKPDKNKLAQELGVILPV